MANIMMPPIVSPTVPDAGVDRKAQLPVAKEGSFAQHLERKMHGKQADKKSLLGVKPIKAQEPRQPEGDGPAEPPATVEAVLQQLMVDLKDMADKPEAEAGQWTFQLQDVGLLEKLAAQAGMDAATLAALKKQMEEQGGLPLADLFAALAESFKELGEAQPVTVAETYLPLLETILSKLGVEPETIKQLDSQGVNGVDQLDLLAYLQALQAVPVQVETQSGAASQQAGAPTCVLTDWELEQFSAMLVEAGVPAEKIEMMFPEKTPLWQKALAGLRPEQGDAPVEMSLERLLSILQEALAAVDEARPKVDVPGFFTELETILSQAGFKSTDVGWTPVVQGTMKAVYEELQKMIDQQKGREDKTIEIIAKNEAVDEEWQLSAGDTTLETLSSGQESDLPGGDTSRGPVADALLVQGEEGANEQQNSVAAVDFRAVSQGGAEPTAKVQAPRLHFTSELQQFAVEQISQGVLRGLKNNEHHMTLTLYPKELGEVKVDLQVRGSQLSATFVMENQKVKEAMESNMGEFKDNLERRGFSLGAMSVSVGQHDQQNDSNQRFAAAWEQSLLSQGRENSAAPGASPLEFTRNDLTTLRQGGISLFV